MVWYGIVEFNVPLDTVCFNDLNMMKLEHHIQIVQKYFTGHIVDTHSTTVGEIFVLNAYRQPTAESVHSQMK